jgi:hypothetical protein
MIKSRRMLGREYSTHGEKMDVSRNWIKKKKERGH